MSDGEETWTILRILQWTTGYFSRKGIEQPRANAEVLLAHSLDMERIGLYLRYDQPLSAAELARFREIVRRRANREPTQHITGKQEFWSLELEVTPDVLIPRPETELLVERALPLVCDAPKTVLDLCTGSGAIAVALAHECSGLCIVATDRSPAALAVAGRNADRHKVRDRVSFAAMDLFGGFSGSAPLFDLIISNPPYIAETELRDLAPEVMRYEPEAALLGGGAEGLGVIRRILREAGGYLKPGGTLLLEMGQGQAEILLEELADHDWIEQYEVVPDYSGIHRVLQLLKADR